MGRLCFVCPASGREVDTGIEVDPVSFVSLRGEQLGCPDCSDVHQMSEIIACVREKRPRDPLSDQVSSPARHPVK
jgi:hypothetical protein